MPKILDVKKDRLRYTKNKTSSSLAIIAIVFNVLYFISLYSSDVGNYYYKMIIGFSVVYNLLFLLITFLCSEGIKAYNINHAYILIAVGAMQIVRIFYLPTKAHTTLIALDGTERLVMSDNQFLWISICLIASAVACVLGGIIGIIKTKTLENYNKELAKQH